MRRYLVIVNLFCSAAFAGTIHVNSLESTPKAAESDCGLFLGNKQGDLIFYADTEFHSLINIDDKVIQLDHVKTINYQKRPGVSGKGDSYDSLFSEGETSARLRLTLVEGCEATGAKCDEVKVSGTLKVSTPKGSLSIPVTGAEHCKLED